MAQLSELLVTKIRAEQRLVQVRQLQEYMSGWQKEWIAARSAYNRLARQDMNGALDTYRLGPVEMSPVGGEVKEESKPIIDLKRSNGNGKTRPDRSGRQDISRLLNYANASQDRLRQMNMFINSLSREYASDTMHMSLVIDELEQEIKRVRMLPLATITGTFGRMVRDLAQELKKEAVLQIIGGETELDKRVLKQIKDPLTHLLRNSVDHGIELPQQREAAGKPRVGTVTLKAEQLGQDVIISISDDGSGLDMEAIRQAVARRSGVDARSLSEEDLKEAIATRPVYSRPVYSRAESRDGADAGREAGSCSEPVTVENA